MDDSNLIFDLLIGQNFTDHASLLIISNSKHLVLTKLPDDQDLITNIERKYTIIAVYVADSNDAQTKWDLHCGDISELEKISSNNY